MLMNSTDGEMENNFGTRKQKMITSLELYLVLVQDILVESGKTSIINKALCN